MKRPLLALTRRYQAALQNHLRQGATFRVQAALRLGREAVRLGLETLDLARIHKTSLAALFLPGDSSWARNRKLKRAGVFFTEAITPIERTHRAGMESAANLHRQNKVLTRRTAQLAAANRDLRQGVIQRRTAQEALRKSGKRHAKLLRESHHLQKHLQRLTHQILSAQENERRKISHDLHDEIAQTLLGINVRLLTLRKGTAACRKDLAKEIASTQRLVEKSVQAINRFAHEFGIRHET
jgi:signal transduction histidine kinase